MVRCDSCGALIRQPEEQWGLDLRRPWCKACFMDAQERVRSLRRAFVRAGEWPITTTGRVDMTPFSQEERAAMQEWAMHMLADNTP